MSHAQHSPVAPDGIWPGGRSAALMNRGPCPCHHSVKGPVSPRTTANIRQLDGRPERGLRDASQRLRAEALRGGVRPVSLDPM